MLRLGVLTSEAFKTADARFITVLKRQLQGLDQPAIKIGHWGDATLEQVPNVASFAGEFPKISFWWYTRKIEIATLVNRLGQKNLRSYLSLDPTTHFPSASEYPFGITYLFGHGSFHCEHDTILADERLVAVFPLKKGHVIEDPAMNGIADHPKLCEEKRWLATHYTKGDTLCLSCSSRCNFSLI